MDRGTAGFRAGFGMGASWTVSGVVCALPRELSPDGFPPSAGPGEPAHVEEAWSARLGSLGSVRFTGAFGLRTARRRRLRSRASSPPPFPLDPSLAPPPRCTGTVGGSASGPRCRAVRRVLGEGFREARGRSCRRGRSSGLVSRLRLLGVGSGAGAEGRVAVVSPRVAGGNGDARRRSR